MGGWHPVGKGGLHPEGCLHPGGGLLNPPAGTGKADSTHHTGILSSLFFLSTM